MAEGFPSFQHVIGAAVDGIINAGHDLAKLGKIKQRVFDQLLFFRWQGGVDLEQLLGVFFKAVVFLWSVAAGIQTDLAGNAGAVIPHQVEHAFQGGFESEVARALGAEEHARKGGLVEKAAAFDFDFSAADKAQCLIEIVQAGAGGELLVVVTAGGAVLHHEDRADVVVAVAVALQIGDDEPNEILLRERFERGAIGIEVAHADAVVEKAAGKVIDAVEPLGAHGFQAGAGGDDLVVIVLVIPKNDLAEAGADTGFEDRGQKLAGALGALANESHGVLIRAHALDCLGGKSGRVAVWAGGRWGHVAGDRVAGIAGAHPGGPLGADGAVNLGTAGVALMVKEKGGDIVAECLGVALGTKDLGAVDQAAPAVGMVGGEFPIDRALGACHAGGDAGHDADLVAAVGPADLRHGRQPRLDRVPLGGGEVGEVIQFVGGDQVRGHVI